MEPINKNKIVNLEAAKTQHQTKSDTPKVSVESVEVMAPGSQPASSSET